MALEALNTLVKKAKAFLPDRGEKTVLDSSQILLEFGRLIVEKSPNGNIRLKIGDGTKKYVDQNYIGEAIITRNDPTTKAVGDSPAGTVNEGKSFTEWLDEVAYAYQEIDLTNVIIDQPDVELGQPLNNNIVLATTISNSGNIADGDAGIVSSSPSIFTPQSFDPRSSYTITGVSGSFNTITDIVLTVQITGKGGEITTRNTTIKVSTKMWWGSSTLTDITDFTQLKSLGNNALIRSRFGDFLFNNNYSHIGFASQIDVGGIGFVDLDINTNEELLTYAMDSISPLTIVNDYGVQVTYNMYRSTYPFGGSTKFRVK